MEKIFLICVRVIMVYVAIDIVGMIYCLLKGDFTMPDIETSYKRYCTHLNEEKRTKNE